MPQRGWRYAVKRLLDIAAASALLLVLAPLLVVLAGLVQLKLGSPVLFRQARAGRFGNPFTVLKFRSMLDARDATGRLRPDDERLTPLGGLLRAASLDELPQLWNVIRGEMSLVGPRPLPPAFVSRYTPEQAERLQVMPGITGWVQVNGRNSLSWEKKFELDVWYVRNWTPWLDIHILLRTLPCVFDRQGIANPGHVTSADFRGAKPSGEEVMSGPSSSDGRAAWEA